MKRTQLKDALRNIWKQKVSYLSIIVIAFLGVATFLGMNYSDGALRINGSTMYNAVNYRDLEIIAINMLHQGDLEAIRGIEGVEDVEPVWSIYVKVSAGDKRQLIEIISITDRINRPVMVSGRMPESAEECVVEQRLANDMGWQLGDAVTARFPEGNLAEHLLNYKRFTIVGIANHPDHTSVAIPDTLYVMVPKEAFDRESILDNGFMKAEIVVKKPAGIDRFSKSYEAIVGAVSARMEEVGAQRTSIQNEEMRSTMQSRMDEAQGQLDEAHAQLQKARDGLDEGWDQLADGDRQIGENETKLTDGQTQLFTSQVQLMEGRDKLAEGEVKLAKAEMELKAGQAALKAARKTLDAGREALVDSWNLKEDAVESVRDALRAGLGSAGDGIEWASRRKADIGNSRLSARNIYITKSFKFDLNKSMESNMRAFLDSGIIPDEDLIALYTALTGGGQ